MNHQGNIRPFHGQLDSAPFVGVLFLMLPLLLFNTSMVFKPGIEVNVDLPVSFQRSGVGDPSLAVAVDANGILYFHGDTLRDQVFSRKVSEEEESLPLSELLVNRYPDLDSNSVLRAVEQGRVRVNGRLARLDDQLKSGQQVELELPSTELLHPKIIQAIEQGGLQPGEVSLLIQADKVVRHEVIIDLCTMAGEIGVGHVLLASRPPDFSQPFEPQPRTEP
ncbi:MAG: biopolymer transporter ExbD [Verrucomicrobiota bacterium]|jgi:biopolymer transport protein ExbD|nr:biopolymer transporter ExbD [Verrucomicrobiota bacterium]MDP7177123.1 biopolymer transporter ExbD [Verrucomicrobiota bacterium]MDP7292331.1 biopolymer transporter ExbD [Verrucomicrobiota bacterium]MDP7441724.1 biopolymer transporter ExbD [Verrucomicrobiota bacterium]HJN81228.1 biopolymer transporter ExbD [Verrucomicrobiota bacterium]|tara:strand:+ start:599 stop:1261 length:663 start_codon:yes stop_codon:yes gene_type:complete